MLELFAKSNGVISQVLITLWKETYAGRRKQIEDGVLSTVVQDIVKDVCPLLQFQPFVKIRCPIKILVNTCLSFCFGYIAKRRIRMHIK